MELFCAVIVFFAASTVAAMASLNVFSLFSPTSEEEIQLLPIDNSSEATEWSREVMRTQHEWLFIEMTVTTSNTSDVADRPMIIYTVRTWTGKNMFHY